MVITEWYHKYDALAGFPLAMLGPLADRLRLLHHLQTACNLQWLQAAICTGTLCTACPAWSQRYGILALKKSLALSVYNFPNSPDSPPMACKSPPTAATACSRLQLPAVTTCTASVHLPASGLLAVEAVQGVAACTVSEALTGGLI
jgi:hypothetical protein